MTEGVNEISFRPITKEDFNLISQWSLSAPVLKWYTKKEMSLEDVKKKYLPALTGEEAVSRFLILIDDHPIGQIQMYKLDDHPDYKRLTGIETNSAGVDLFIGDENYLHKGYGSRVLKAFVNEFVFAQLDVESCVAGPNPENKVSIRAFEKAGFSYLKTIFNPDENEHEYLMELQKETIGV